jgi:diguanylate cyclase (GGDEF)-like protein
MKAVAAARRWWTARRHGTAAQGGAGALEPALAAVASNPPIARLSSAPIILVILAVAAVACAAAGSALARYEVRRAAIERHAALSSSLDELHAVFGDVHHIDRAGLDFIAQRSRLQDLRFAAEPARGGGREIQPLLDARGRIVGWFSWAPDNALSRAMGWLWALASALGLALTCCAIFGARAVRRLERGFARSADTVRKLRSEDALTGLPNQRIVLDSLDRLLQRSLASGAFARRMGGRHIAFARIDFDGFREVNDTLGRHGGDAVILALAEHLKAGLPQGAILGRFKRNEFAAIASGDSAQAADHLVQALRAAASSPVVAGRAWPITARIGVAQAPEDGITADELARRAGLALRAVKPDGHGAVRRFAPQIESEHADRLFLLRELKAAIAARAFVLHYQPIVAAAGGAVIGVEALLRWTHPERGAIAPATFIPIAEQHGLMQEIGEFVLRRALADAVRWPDLFIAVNLSPLQIRDPHFVALVGNIMAQTGVDASRVVLEMTEGVLIDDLQEIQARLEALRALGVSLALDDFGTGYSSLSYLQKFPFHRLKIDRAFVATLGAAGNASAIIHSIVSLGHALGMIVLAEGVETDQQRVLLRLAGCDEMQGFLFAMPQPADAIDKIVTRSASGGAKEQTVAAAS